LGVECKTRHEYLGARMETKKNYQNLKDGLIIVVGAPLVLLFPLSISFFFLFFFFWFVKQLMAIASRSIAIIAIAKSSSQGNS